MNKYVLVLILYFRIGCGETNEQDANTIEGNTDTSQITIAQETNLWADFANPMNFINMDKSNYCDG
ncbi:hypothetical protein NXW94_30580 [Bacteroides ovatus]|nr:hypothetical protein [Bacteroides ovatus]